VTFELAQFLEGPVAKRFGKPNLKWEVEGARDAAEEALWLMHLLAKCLTLQLCAEIHVGFGNNIEAHITSLTDCMLGCHGDGSTIVEALARAMLAVPA
jgi:hypothetical protein